MAPGSSATMDSRFECDEDADGSMGALVAPPLPNVGNAGQPHLTFFRSSPKFMFGIGGIGGMGGIDKCMKPDSVATACLLSPLECGFRGTIVAASAGGHEGVRLWCEIGVAGGGMRVRM